jgi:glucosamine-6-phosphate deaminase
MNFIDTVQGSLLEGFFPAGWDLKKIDACCSHSPDEILERQPFWHENFQPVPCDNIIDFDTFMGHEIALQIKNARQEDKKLAMILPVGPMGMYKCAEQQPRVV